MPKSCPGSPITRSRGFRCCRAPRSSRWRWPRHGCADRIAAAIEVSDVELRRPLPFDKGRAREIRCIEVGDDGDWELTSRPRLADDPPTLHAVARLATAGEFIPPPLFGPAGPSRAAVDAATLYSLAARLGLDYGGRFRTVRRIELLGSARGGGATRPVGYRREPGALHHPSRAARWRAAELAGADRRKAAGTSGISPARAFCRGASGGCARRLRSGASPHSARLRVTRVGTRSAAADMALFDEAGAIVAELSDCWFRRVELTRRAAPDEAALRIDLVPAPLREDAAPAVLSAIADILSAAGRRFRCRRRGAGRAEIAAGRADRLGGARGAAGRCRCRASNLRSTKSSRTAPSPPMPRRCSNRCSACCGASGRLRKRIGSGRSTARATCPRCRKSGVCCSPSKPELVSELALIAAAAEELPGLLAAGRRPEASPAPMIEHLLHASPVSSAGIELICAALGEIAARWPEGRTLRVLEIGADGGMTRRALDRLAQSGAAFRYVATATDAEQVARLGSVVSATPEASAACWAAGRGGRRSRRRPLRHDPRGACLRPVCGSTRRRYRRCAICWLRAV